MSKFSKRVYRKDQTEDHCHTLKDGQKTGGELLKPQAVLGNEDKLEQGHHTHLYQHYGNTLESMISSNEPGHTHDTELGESSGPQSVRMDSANLERNSGQEEIIKPRG